MSRDGKATGEPGSIAFNPSVGWVRSYERGWLRGDLIAGIAVAALIVPKNLGYAAIVGIPVQNGLYAAAAGAIVYAVFGTSCQISTGPSSGLAAVAASAVVAAKITGTLVLDSHHRGLVDPAGSAPDMTDYRRGA